MKKIILTLLFSFLLPTTSFAYIRNGTETNGGDGFVADFYRVLDNTIKILNSKSLEDIEQVQLIEIKKQRSNLDVISAPSVFLNDKELSAINNPYFSPPRITISQKFWQGFSEEQKIQLVLHEMLPVVGFSDHDYKFSGALMAKILPSSQDLATIYDLIDTCSLSRIDSFDMNTLKFAKKLNYLIHSAALKGCGTFVKKAVQSGWDIDYCWKQKTSYQDLDATAFNSPDQLFVKWTTLDVLKSLGANPLKICTE
ncbi:hypothetical protein [Bdellovibrio sp. BCCA]|uniref:hypothetical protein n=1 Tax=Bdellovibrio sp. BCCA TaxID=3136281 RepID=UPI0030F2B0D2